MQEFDPRRSGPRRRPARTLALALLVVLACVGWRIGLASLGHGGPTAKAAALASHKLPALPLGAQTAPTAVAITIRPGEPFDAALRRAGAATADAHEATASLGEAFDIRRVKAGLTFVALMAPASPSAGAPRLLGLTLRSGPVSTLSVSRAGAGPFHVRRQDEAVREDTEVAQGAMRESLYQSALAVGAPPTVTAEVIKLFAHKLDFSRDIRAGDRFRLVFDRKVTASGRLVQVGDLDYAEISAKGQMNRFYRFQPRGAQQAQYFDETGKTVKALLLRTPVYGARITSGFGMRLHPILGYTRMHQGIDFGVPVGTPVLAAGDGVVEQARWEGGYGRFLKLRHAGGWETAYGHLSRWAARPGQHVRQGQVIAYSGSTGESTGPHVHFEVLKGGVRVNPKSAKVPAGSILHGAELAAFEVQRVHMDTALAQTPTSRPLILADLPVVVDDHLRRDAVLTR